MSNYGFYHFVSRFLPYGGRSAPISQTRNIILSLPAARFSVVLYRYRYHFVTD